PRHRPRRAALSRPLGRVAVTHRLRGACLQLDSPAATKGEVKWIHRFHRMHRTNKQDTRPENLGHYRGMEGRQRACVLVVTSGAEGSQSSQDADISVLEHEPQA